MRSKLTPEVQTFICELVAEGNFLNAAARACGVSQRIAHRWNKRGRDEIARLEDDPTAEPDPIHAKYVEFHLALEGAIAASEVPLVRCWHAAGREDWRAAKAMLAARNPKDWGPKAEPPEEPQDILAVIAGAVKRAYEGPDEEPGSDPS